MSQTNIVDTTANDYLANCICCHFGIKNKHMKRIQTLFIVGAMALIMASCSTADGDYGGSEYIPDMVHSVAYEANVYDNYSHNTWDDESTIPLKALASLNKPVKGTIPRGYAGMEFSGNSAEMQARLTGKTQINEKPVPLNGSAPYYYKDTEEERARAIAEIISNPFPITEAGLARGKELYGINCAICHGTKGNGLGYLVNDEKNPNVKFPAQPANFTQDAFVNSSNGRFYHAIMYGKNMMGSFADKLSYEERWQVIHYIRSLQANSKNLEYNELSNTLNEMYGTPMGAVHHVEDVVEPMMESHESPAVEHHNEH